MYANPVLIATACPQRAIEPVPPHGWCVYTYYKVMVMGTLQCKVMVIMGVYAIRATTSAVTRPPP